MLVRAVLVAAVAALLFIPSSATASRDCGAPLINGGLYDVRVERGHTGCATARAVVRRYFAATPEHCGGSACVITLRGWTCASAYSDFPLVATCRRNGARIAVYAAGD